MIGVVTVIEVYHHHLPLHTDTKITKTIQILLQIIIKISQTYKISPIPINQYIHTITILTLTLTRLILIQIQIRTRLILNQILIQSRTSIKIKSHLANNLFILNKYKL